MKVDKFINNSELKNIILRVRAECKDKFFIDVIDDDGNQYVDLVMEGGGMLGIALVGYVHVLEQAGIRFLGLGGASAGSISALLLAALGVPSEAKGQKLAGLLASKNFYDFIDGDDDAKDFIKSWRAGASSVKLTFKALQILDNVRHDLGLNPGKQFEVWLESILKNEGISNYKQLRARMNVCPKGLRTRDGEALDTPEKMCSELAIIAADVSTETKVEFPRMASLYWKDPCSVSPALFVRASMSIPFFFQPLIVKNLPKGPEIEQLWKDLAGYSTVDEGGPPKDAVFVDGGVMSNFPIDVFHNKGRVPIAPTFGVKLELDKRRNKIAGPLSMMFAIFNSARHTLDYDFLHKNLDYRHLVTWIPAKGFDWLEFDMSERKRLKLFLEGANCAADFLAKFDWDGYKKIRKGILEADLASKR